MGCANQPMAVAITKARWARCRKKELSIHRRCAKVEAAIKTGMAILASNLGQSKASILVERAGKIILNPKNKRKTTIVVRDFLIKIKRDQHGWERRILGFCLDYS